MMSKKQMDKREVEGSTATDGYYTESEKYC